MRSTHLWLVNRLLAFLALGALACVTTGCGSGPTLTPVKGIVTVGGKPATSGTVTFKPDKAKGNTAGVEPIGEINSSGEYTLMTKGKPGAPLGAYKVVVAGGGEVPMDNTKVGAQPTNQFNRTYMSPETTPLEVTVVEKAAAGAYDLKLTP